MPDANHDAVPNANHDADPSSSAANEVERLLAVRDEARQLARDLPVADNRQVAIGRIATTAAAEVRDAERELADLQRFSPAKLWAQLRGTRAEDIDRQNGVVERAHDKLATARIQHEAARGFHQRLEAREAELTGVGQQVEGGLQAVEEKLLTAGHARGCPWNRCACVGSLPPASSIGSSTIRPGCARSPRTSTAWCSG